MLTTRFTDLCRQQLPAPGTRFTAYRFRQIFEAGREDLSLAKLAEAHWDAVAILREAGHEPAPDACYAVWASEIPGRELRIVSEGAVTVSGTKQFCSGAGMVNRALITAGPGGSVLVEVDLQAAPERLSMDASGWRTDAFRMTNTAAVTFRDYPVAAVIGEESWYTKRRGFWPGACSPAAAWAGGAAALVDFALESNREDAHTLAHLAAMQADIWQAKVCLLAAAEEFERPGDDGMVRALTVRHLVEQACQDVLTRFGRALGPGPLAKDAEIARRSAELQLYLRQCHAERDLESLGRTVRAQEQERRDTDVQLAFSAGGEKTLSEQWLDDAEREECERD